MSRRASSSAGTVSLFPFLAVLVCAMGALILLLLVTTRRIRQRTLDEPVVAQSREAESSSLIPREHPLGLTPVDVSAKRIDPHETPILPDLADDVAAQSPPLPPVAPPPAAYDPTPDFRQRLAELEAQRAGLLAGLSEQRQRLAEIEAALDVDRTRLADADTAAAAVLAEKQRLNDLYIRLRQEKQNAEQRAEELRQTIERTRNELVDADSKFAFVPYDGVLGTNRRPIIIECHADRLVFASEGVSLRATDLDGFNARYNPLLYATKGLIRYWERRDRTSTAEDLGEPYLLLVVRPGGTTAYYVARELLSGLQEPFGYELVTEEQEFAWPPSEAEAVGICRTIVEKMLAERDELLDVALRSGASLSEFSSPGGQFRLEEVERIKNPTREVTINGQRFSRDAAGGPGGMAADRSTGVSDPTTPAERLKRFDRPGQSAAAANGTTGQSDGSGFPDQGSGLSAAPRTAEPQGVYTRQNGSITQADRMPEWLRDGTARLPQQQSQQQSQQPHSQQQQSQRLDQTDSFADAIARRQQRADVSDGAASSTATADANVTAQEPGSRSGQSAERTRQPDPEMLTFTPEGARTAASGEPVQPSWGLRTGSGNIGFEREIRVRITATQLTVASGEPVPIDASLSAVDLRRLLTAAINREVRGWGPPPKSFYWVPAIRFAITPEAKGHHDRVRRIVQGWDLRSSTEFVPAANDGDS